MLTTKKMYDHIKSQDPELFNVMEKEEVRQKEGIELIPSENYVSEAVLEACGSILTNKYSTLFLPNLSLNLAFKGYIS